MWTQNIYKAMCMPDILNLEDSSPPKKMTPSVIMDNISPRQRSQSNPGKETRYSDEHALVLWIKYPSSLTPLPLTPSLSVHMSDSHSLTLSHHLSFRPTLTPSPSQIIDIYDFLWIRRVILSNVRTDSQLDINSCLVKFPCELGQIMTRYVFLWTRKVILSNIQSESNLT